MDINVVRVEFAVRLAIPGRRHFPQSHDFAVGAFVANEGRSSATGRVSLAAAQTDFFDRTDEQTRR